MALNISRTESSLALWSRRLAVFCLQLLFVSVIIHQLGFIDTPTVVNLISVSLIGGAAAFIMAVVGLIRIWYQGLAGTGWAVMAIFLVGLLFLIPGWSMQKLIFLPAINDISTDLQHPPGFEKLVAVRGKNAPNHLGIETAIKQAEAYPDIVPLSLDRSSGSVFTLVESVIEGLGWEIVSQRPPRNNATVGIIEATDRTLLVGYKDDIVVRIQGDGEHARVDIRSASRFGKHDLGTNAKRIRTFIESVKTRLAKVEANRATERARAAIKAQKLKRAKRLKAKRKRAARSTRRAKSRKRVRKKRSRRRNKRRPRRRQQPSNPFSLF